jgi:hypothetical protein
MLANSQNFILFVALIKKITMGKTIPKQIRRLTMVHLNRFNTGKRVCECTMKKIDLRPARTKADKI